MATDRSCGLRNTISIMEYHWIQKHLVAEDKTQVELADYMEISTDKLSKSISGVREFSPKEILKLSEFFKIPAEQAITGQPTIPFGHVSIDGTVPGGVPMEAIQSTDRKFVLYPVPNTRDRFGAFIVVGDSMNNIAAAGSIVIVNYSHQDPANLNGKPIIAIANGECTFKRLYLNPNILVPDSTNKQNKPIALNGEWSVLGEVVGVINRLEEGV